jgi:hypothetical protein
VLKGGQKKAYKNLSDTRFGRSLNGHFEKEERRQMHGFGKVLDLCSGKTKKLLSFVVQP